MTKQEIKYLLNTGCKLREDGHIFTESGDYVGLSTIDDSVASFIVEHKLTKLQSIDTALGKPKNNNESCYAVGIGFNEERQAWYGFTHRGYMAYSIGWKANKTLPLVTEGNLPEDFECKTLEDCKLCAIKMSELLD